MKKCFLALFQFFILFFTIYGQTTLPPDMVLVQAGTQTLGCTSEQSPCETDECLGREVNVPDFYISKYEVTQAQWESVMMGNPSILVLCGADCPVEQISWYQAAVFCNRLSEVLGYTPCYYENATFTRVFGKNGPPFNNPTWPVTTVNNGPIYWKQDANGFRFPTEVEWEYAARGGNLAAIQTKYSGSNNPDDVAWYFINSGAPSYTSNSPLVGGRGTRSVGQKAPNALGLYDMSGNVWEYCYDYYGACSTAQTCNPIGPTTGSNRTARGGGITSSANFIRIANRSDSGIGVDPTVSTLKDIGIRLVRTP